MVLIYLLSMAVVCSAAENMTQKSPSLTPVLGTP